MGYFGDRLVALGFKNYNQYLSSPIWKAFKNAYRSSGRTRNCIVCGMTPIQLHHHTYERLGCEGLDDVTPLCRDHHVQVHACLKTKHWLVEKTSEAVVLLRSGERFDATLVVRPVKKERKPYKKGDWKFYRDRSLSQTWRKKGKGKKNGKKKTGKAKRDAIDPRRGAMAEEILELGIDTFADLARELMRLQRVTGYSARSACVNIIAARDLDAVNHHIAKMKVFRPKKGREK